MTKRVRDKRYFHIRTLRWEITWYIPYTGIARYEGLRTMTVAGVTRDYIMLQYAGSEALYIPVDQA